MFERAKLVSDTNSHEHAERQQPGEPRIASTGAVPYDFGDRHEKRRAQGVGMSYVYRLLALSIFVGTLAACSSSLESGPGLSLPAGDAALGRQAFVDLQCHACHTIPRVELPDIDLSAPVSVELGRATSDITTYEELVTAIINPSHKLIYGYPAERVSVDGETFMPNVNNLMTVQQLIDLVEFLRLQYGVIPPRSAPYAIYRYD